MIALPLLWGQAMALHAGAAFSWGGLWMGLAFGAACQVYALYLNDHADEGLDRNQQAYFLSGGSRVIPDGQLTAAQLFRGAQVALLSMAVLAAISALHGRPAMLLLFGLAAGAGWSYSLPPWPASYRGLGEWHQGLSCGLLLPLTGYYLQSGTLGTFPWLAALPLFLLFAAGNIVTALPDRESDAAGGKRTHPVRHGASRSRCHAMALLLLSCVSAVALAAGPVGIGRMFAVVLPAALALLVLALPAGPVSPVRRFVGVLTASQAWMLSAWTILLFAMAPDRGGP